MDKYDRQLQAVDREVREVLGKAKEITELAAAEGRGMNEDEDKRVKGFLAQVDVLKEQRRETEAAIETRNRVRQIGETIEIDEDARAGKSERPQMGSIGEAFVKSDGYKRLREQGFTGNWSTGPIELEFKTLLSEASGSGGKLVVPQYEPGIVPTLFQRLTVADLMASGTTDSNTINYMIESSVTNAAAAVAEGASKPESTLVFDMTTEPVKKIATFLPVTEEMLEDVAGIQSYINGRLSLFVKIQEENSLLNGAGGNDLSGLIGRIPANNKGLRSSAASASDSDHVFRAISRVRESYLEPDGILIHPNDWEGMVAAKDTTGGYLGGGPWVGQPYTGAPSAASQSPLGTAPTLWGLRVVVTNAVAEAKPIVGAFQTGAQVYRKGGLSIDASNSHSTFFQENKVAIRAEERLALAVYRPTAFAIADLGVAGAGT